MHTLPSDRFNIPKYITANQCNTICINVGENNDNYFLHTGFCTTVETGVTRVEHWVTNDEEGSERALCTGTVKECLEFIQNIVNPIISKPF